MQIFFIAVLEFLYNNLITVAIISIGFLLLITSARLIYLEYRFNHHLNLKKIFFGDRRPFKAKSFNARRVLTFTLGLVLLFLIGYQAFGNPISYQQNTKEIDSNLEAIEIYETFASRFYSDPFSNTLLTPNNDVSFEQNQSDTLMGFDYVIETTNRIFVLNQDGVQVLSKSNHTISYLSELSFLEPQCALESLQPKGIATYNNLLIVLSTESLGQCNSNPLNYVLRDNRTHVSIYDVETLEKVKEYEVSGHLNDAYVDNQQIVLVNSTWIPFADESIDLNNYVPFYIEDQFTIKQSIEDILYIEKTEPNSFISTTKIDYMNQTIDQVSILSDYQNQLDIKREGIILALDVVNFNQASDLFELQNPIKSIDTAVVQFNIFNEEIYYFRTQVIDGQILTNDGAFFTNYGLNVFTKSSNGLNSVYSFTETLRYLNKTTLANRFEVNGIIYENNYYYVDYNKELSNHYTYQLHEDSITLVATKNNSTFYDAYAFISDSYYVASQQFDNNKLRLYLLRHYAGSSLYEIDFEVEFFVNNVEFLVQPSDLENIVLLENQESIVIPTYLYKRASQVISENEVLSYSFVSSTFQTMVLGPLGQFRTPFGYRMITYGDKAIHITPGGYQITDLDNIENIQRTIYFANQ